MPLSEHEQKVLQAMEQALYAEDPRFATHITNHGLHHSKRKIILGAIGVVAGLALVVLAVLNGVIWLGVVGFALMVAGGVYAFAPGKKPTIGAVAADGTVKRPTGARKSSTGGPSGRATRSSFMQRIEERWDKRRNGDQGW